MIKIVKMILLIFILLLVSWYFYTTTVVNSSFTFYHWTSIYGVDVNETRPPAYIKVLDISYEDALMVRKTSFKTLPTKIIIPVIYMDNEVWLKMKPLTMIKKVLEALKSMPLGAYKEIQVDCDWTESTRESYFEFLKQLTEQSGKKLSATIRLHQVKYYTKTGVPPVDYGVLMYYNMSDFKDIETKNYILDLEVAQRYHYHFDTYPLRLNLALPLYSQATIIRFSKVAGLIEGLREKELDEDFEKIAEHFFVVKKTHYFKQRLFYEGDTVRIDEVDVATLLKGIEGLKKVMKQPKEIIFYHWGNCASYGDRKLKEVVESW